jgi:hypothetical protein
MEYIYNDGGREAAGFKGKCGDCVTRAVAIASGRPYAEVYATLADGMGTQRKAKGRTARNGISVSRKWFKDYMHSIGFVWTPTMLVGSGCKTHLTDGELPMGRLVVRVSGHCTAVIDGVVNDTWNPQRETHLINTVNGVQSFGVGKRCVYGYWRLA